MISAQTWPVFNPLWQGAPPGALGTGPGDSVHVWAFPASVANNTGAAIVICPGGGYANLALSHEGYAPAVWFQSRGISTFVLKYRLGSAGYRHPIEMQDAQRAMRWVRSNAVRYRVDPRRVGILGFSAGGHLASTVGTHYDAGNPTAIDTVDRQSCRPDFQLLLYPVITMNSTFTHTGSRNNLLGTAPSQALVDLLSNELQVTPQTPPAFLVHGINDAVVPVRNSQAFYDSCRSKGVLAELHLLTNGPHGFGLADGQYGAPTLAEASQWPPWAMTWMNARGFLTPTALKSKRGVKSAPAKTSFQRLSGGSVILHGPQVGEKAKDLGGKTKPQ